MENKAFIQNYLSEVRKVTEAISVEDIDRAIDLLFGAWKNRSQVFTCGNGGSASTAIHFACDLSKTTIVEGKKRFKAYCLNDNIPLTSALINDEGFDNLFYEQLKANFEEGDVLICISVHGGAGRDKAGLWSQNLLKAMKYVKDKGGSGLQFKQLPKQGTSLVSSYGLIYCSCLS